MGFLSALRAQGQGPAPRVDRGPLGARGRARPEPGRGALPPRAAPRRARRGAASEKTTAGDADVPGRTRGGTPRPLARAPASTARAKPDPFDFDASADASVGPETDPEVPASPATRSPAAKSPGSVSRRRSPSDSEPHPGGPSGASSARNRPEPRSAPRETRPEAGPRAPPPPRRGAPPRPRRRRMRHPTGSLRADAVQAPPRHLRRGRRLRHGGGGRRRRRTTGVARERSRSVGGLRVPGRRRAERRRSLRRAERGVPRRGERRGGVRAEPRVGEANARRPERRRVGTRRRRLADEPGLRGEPSLGDPAAFPGAATTAARRAAARARAPTAEPEGAAEGFEAFDALDGGGGGGGGSSGGGRPLRLRDGNARRLDAAARLAVADEAQYALSGTGDRLPVASRLGSAAQLVAVAADPAKRRALAAQGLVPAVLAASLRLATSDPSSANGAARPRAGVIETALGAPAKETAGQRETRRLAAAALLYLSLLDADASDAAEAEKALGAANRTRDLPAALASLLETESESSAKDGEKAVRREAAAEGGFAARLADESERRAESTVRGALRGLKFLPHEAADAQTPALLAAHRAVATRERSAAAATARDARRRARREEAREAERGRRRREGGGGGGGGRARGVRGGGGGGRGGGRGGGGGGGGGGLRGGSGVGRSQGGPRRERRDGRRREARGRRRAGTLRARRRVLLQARG